MYINVYTYARTNTYRRLYIVDARIYARTHMHACTNDTHVQYTIRPYQQVVLTRELVL